MQDLFQKYVSDLNKLRDAFHDELAATAENLSKAMGIYARRSEAALASFMEKVSARGMELEASRRRGSISFGVFQQTAACQMSMTGR